MATRPMLMKSCVGDTIHYGRLTGYSGLHPHRDTAAAFRQASRPQRCSVEIISRILSRIRTAVSSLLIRGSSVSSFSVIRVTTLVSPANPAPVLSGCWPQSYPGSFSQASLWNYPAYFPVSMGKSAEKLSWPFLTSQTGKNIFRSLQTYFRDILRFF